MKKDGETWDGEAITGGSHPAIDLDSSKQPWISYLGSDSEGQGSVFYSHREGDSWSDEIIDQKGDRYISNKSVDLAIADDQLIHVSYFDSVSQQLMYAQGISSTWQLEAIAPASWNAIGSIALDSLNRPSIAFLGYHNGDKLDLIR